MQSLSSSSCINPNFLVLFDEAFNSVSNLKQLNVHISYFDNQENVVCRNYYDPQFPGHAISQDQLKSFKTIFKNLIMMVQKINWAFFRSPAGIQ